MSGDPAVEAIRADLRATHERMADGVQRLVALARAASGAGPGMQRIAFHTDARMAAAIAQYMNETRRHNQAAAIRQLILLGLDTRLSD